MSTESIPNHEKPKVVGPERPEIETGTPLSTELNPEHVETLGELSIEKVLNEENIDVNAFQEIARVNVNHAYHAAEKYGNFAPSLASAVMHYGHKTPEAIYPTAAQIKQESFGARLISGFLGFFSSRWANRFDNYLERKARQRISAIAQSTNRTIEIIGNMEAPKKQFVQDIAHLHTLLAQNPSRNRMPELVYELSSSADENESYPLLKKIMKLPAVSERLINRRRLLRAFTPEIIRGIEQFLKSHGVKAESTATADNNSLTRRLAKRFVPTRVNDLPDRIERILSNAYGVLPENGERFKRSLNKLCETIIANNHNGKSGSEITKNIVREINNLLKDH